MIRSFHHSDFPLELLRERKRESVTAVRFNDHQPLSALGPMASAVAAAVFRRLQQDGRLDRGEAASQRLVERPPFATLHAHA